MQEVSQLLLLLLLLSLRLRDFDLDLPLLLEDLLEDLLLDDLRDEDKAPDDKSFLPLIDAGDLGGRWFGAIVFIVFECKGGRDSALFDILIVNLAEFIVAYYIDSSWCDNFDAIDDVDLITEAWVDVDGNIDAVCVPTAKAVKLNFLKVTQRQEFECMSNSNQNLKRAQR